MKTVRIKNTVNSADMNILQIYHTAITASNLLTSSVSQSGEFTGEDLYKGLDFQVEDDVAQFFVQNITRCTNLGSGSLTENSNVVEFYTIDAGDYGSVVIRGTVTRTTTTSTTVRQNFSTHPTLQLDVAASYPYEFGGWWDNPDLTGEPLSTDNPTTLYSGSFDSTTSLYVGYQLGDNYY